MGAMRPTAESTLTEIKAYLHEEAREGTKCPACHQDVRVYRRKLNAGEARGLVVLYRAVGLEYGHIPTIVGSKDREEAKLRYWGLLEELKVKRPDGGRAGWWHVTERGRDWILGRITVPSHVFTYNKRLLRVDDSRYITIKEALGTEFDLEELLHS